MGNLTLTIIMGVLIVVLLLIATVYAMRYYKKEQSYLELNLKNEEKIEQQLNTWCNENTIQSLSKEDLFSPTRMKNSEIDEKSIEIEWIDYTKDVLWFFRKQG